MMLNLTATGERGDLPPVLLVHGLFGSGRNLAGLARRLAGDGRHVLSVDMRNHGDSFHDPDHSYPSLADDLAEVIEAHGGTADLVGHSMGGKASMVLALNRPKLLRRLVVMDIAPVGYGHSQVEYIDAMEGLDLKGLELRSEADRRLASAIDEPGVRAFLLQSLDLRADPPRWKLNLSALRDQMDRLVGWPDDLPQGGFDGPMLAVAGSESDYVGEEGRAAIRACFPQAEFRVIEGAGHWLHADKPAEVAELVVDFLS